MAAENNPNYFDSNFLIFVLVFGSRYLNTASSILVRKKLTELNLDKKRVCILSGGAIGPDTWAVQWATEHEIVSLTNKPNYNRLGRVAPIVRDRENVNKCHWAIGFWDGSSKGTAYTLMYLKQSKKPYILWIHDETGFWFQEKKDIGKLPGQL